MRKRTLAREFAVQILYQIDITGDTYERSLADFWQAHDSEEIKEEVKTFSSELVKGARDNLAAIDAMIEKYATNWELKRMAVVDRNILRLTSYELLFRDDIPPKVAINEGVELAKKFSDLNAGKYVNGILDKIKLERNK